jgi:hypothetical protein
MPIRLFLNGEVCQFVGKRPYASLSRMGLVCVGAGVSRSASGGTAMETNGTILNYINGRWQSAPTDEYQDVTNPATGETLIRTPLSGADVVDEAAKAAAAALPGWRSTPPGERIQYLFKSQTVARRKF